MTYLKRIGNFIRNSFGSPGVRLAILQFRIFGLGLGVASTLFTGVNRPQWPENGKGLGDVV
jgi:hypothetical protein